MVVDERTARGAEEWTLLRRRGPRLAREPVDRVAPRLVAQQGAVGLARENHGAAGLAALVCYLVTTEGAKIIIASSETTYGVCFAEVGDTFRR